MPILNEIDRMNLVEECNLVDKIVLSGLKNHIPHIVKENPKIIALGYDQKFYVKKSKKDLKNKGILIKIIRLKPYKKIFLKITC